MARVKINKIIERSEIRSALEDAVKKHFPGQEAKATEVYEEFRKSVKNRFSEWMTVSSGEVDC